MKRPLVPAAKFLRLHAFLDVVNSRADRLDLLRVFIFNFATELTRGLTAIENARMEWNSARLKFPVLSGEAARPAGNPAQPDAAQLPLGGLSLGQLCKLGLALTWPLSLVALLALGLMVFLVVR